MVTGPILAGSSYVHIDDEHDSKIMGGTDVHKNRVFPRLIFLISNLAEELGT